MQDLPAIFEIRSFAEFQQSLGFVHKIKFCKSDLYFLSRRKNVRWPLITAFQCICKYRVIFMFILLLYMLKLLSYQHLAAVEKKYLVER